MIQLSEKAGTPYFAERPHPPTLVYPSGARQLLRIGLGLKSAPREHFSSSQLSGHRCFISLLLFQIRMARLRSVVLGSNVTKLRALLRTGAKTARGGSEPTGLWGAERPEKLTTQRVSASNSQRQIPTAPTY